MYLSGSVGLACIRPLVPSQPQKRKNEKKNRNSIDENYNV
jgi:hypothetical protein